jgi:hypothetical protein
VWWSWVLILVTTVGQLVYFRKRGLLGRSEPAGGAAGAARRRRGRWHRRGPAG